MLKIIAFGDSLTAGVQSPSPENPTGRPTPYGLFLEQLLSGKAEVVVRGVSGELTGEMVMRLGREVIGLNPDYVVVLGGTNDLGWRAPMDEILRNLVTIYERIRSAGAVPVAVSVPSIRGFDELIGPRQALNRAIIEYCRSNHQPMIDLFTETAEPESFRLAETYSNDGLHLTTEGYRKIAELLYRDVLGPVVNP
jgi:acyl-CoA thioesterase I